MIVTGPKQGLSFSRRRFIGAIAALAAGACGVREAAEPEVPEAGPGVGETSGVDRWADGFPGRVFPSGHPDYEHWRRGMPWQTWTAPRRPALIVRPDSREGVAPAIDFAREQGLTVAVKSGGHNVSEAFLRDGGMLLDLGELRDLRIDPATRTAWVGPALWGHGLMQEAARYRLGFPVAHCASVPMGGYLLGGGVGHNGDEWGGIACHSVLAAELVLADGSTVVVDADNHADLLWAVRGAGTGFFAAVTRYKLRLYDLPREIFESSYFFPLSRLDTAVELMQDIAAPRPAKMELMTLMGHNPLAGPGTAPLDTKAIIVRAVAFADSREEAADILAPAARHPLANQALDRGEMVANNFEEMARDSVDARMGLGFGNYAVDAVWTDDVAATLRAVAEHFVAAPSPGSHYVVSPRLNPALRDDCAFSRIGETFVGAYAVWRDSADDAANFGWLADAAALMRPHAAGQYINEVDLFRDPGAVRRCFSARAWSRLRNMRRTYDPLGVFADYHPMCSSTDCLRM